MVRNTQPKSIKTTLPLKTQVEELTTVLRLARASFDIWWYFTNKKFVDANRELIDELSQFFYFNNEANFCSFVTRICILFDKTKSAQDLESVGKIVFSATPKDAVQLMNFKTLLLNAQKSADKLLVLRHNVMAHKSRFSRFSEVYRTAGITPNEMLALTSICLEAINILREQLAMYEVMYENDFLGNDLKALAEIIRSSVAS